MNKKRSVIALIVLMIVTVFMPVSQVDAASRPKMSVEQLRQQFPHRSYWASPDGNPLSTSNVAPSQSAGSVIGNVYKMQSDDGERELRFCGGFAGQMYELYNGSSPNQGKSYYGYLPDITNQIPWEERVDDIYSYIKPGSIVNMQSDNISHSIFVVGVNGSSLDTVEANVQEGVIRDGDNLIIWDNAVYNRQYLEQVMNEGGYVGVVTPNKQVNNNPATSTSTPSNNPKPSNTIEMYRMYNPQSGEHFYTASTTERDHLVKYGWKYEGIGWNAPATGDPVYRLFSGTDHHYTTSSGERDALVKAGWKYEGIGWYSGGSTPLYRLYNPNAKTGSHHYTTSTTERDHLVKVGWKYEGIGWYGN